MKIKIFFSFLTSIAILIGCSKEQKFEDFFHKAIDEMHIGEKDYSYSLVHKQINVMQKDDAIAVFKEHNERGK